MVPQLLQAIDARTVLIFIIVLLIIWLYQSTKLPDNFPPGPPPLPVIGNLGLFTVNASQSYKTLTELSNKYGRIIGLKLGSVPTVLLNGVEAAREALLKNNEIYTSRPIYMFGILQSNLIEGQLRGLFFTEGHIWRESRRFTLSSMRDFGLGKRSLEERMMEEADAMCSEISKHAGKPYDVTTLTQAASSNVICSICFGSRFDYKTPEFQKLLHVVRAHFTAPVFASFLNFLPFLLYLPKPSWVKMMKENLEHAFEFVQKQIELHRASYDPNQLRDLIDLYLEKETKGLSDDEVYSRANVVMIVTGLFFAGTDTVSTTIRWLVLHMLRYPQAQRRCQAEIDSVIGSSRQPSLADRTIMPYVEATINEVQRIATVAALALPHTNSEDTMLGGYSIPKGTLILVNLYAIHMDPEYWENPEEFNPERWLDPNGKVKKIDSFMPFSAGGRICLGESLAKNELFLFTATLLQRFHFTPEDPHHLPSMQGHMGFTVYPEEFRVIATPR